MAKNRQNNEVYLDDIDKLILRELMNNSRMPATELAPIIGLSVPATNNRIQKLSEKGIIEQFTIRTNLERIGKNVVAFVNITIDQYKIFDNLMRYIRSNPQIQECYAITGEFDYLIRVCTGSIRQLEDIIIDLKKIEGVVGTNTVISLETHKFAPYVLPE
ncbi:MAG: Lrp/AsnC family transcriptional regulator [Saccharofermentanales bacterium]